ncbi:MAG: hypothetical protein LM580_08380 [Thermofilum sp.]|nr:hypothetical protein [Thermofilum sp.]
MPDTIPYAIVEIDKRGVAKVSVFVGQNEIIRLTGVRKVYVDYDEQKSHGLWLVPVASFRNHDDTVFIVTPMRAVNNALITATVNAVEHVIYRLAGLLETLVPKLGEETVKEALKSPQQ